MSSKWIKSTRKKPKETGYYLCYGKLGTALIINICFYDVKVGKFQLVSASGMYKDDKGNITHWMPLPDPPKR